MSTGYLRKIRFKARKKAKKDMDSLIFLAENYPQAIDGNDLKLLLNTYLKHGKSPELERVRIPVRDLKTGKVRSRIRSPWGPSAIQIAGTLRNEDGSLLEKPEIYRKIRMSYELLKIIHKRLTELPPLKSGQVIVLKKDENEGVKLRIETFSKWLEEFLRSSGIINSVFANNLYEAINQAAKNVKLLVVHT